jgi:repressor LexA
MKLTDRQREILTFINDYRESHNYSPSYENIAEHFKITVGGLQGALDSLEKKGAITRGKWKYRTIRVVDGVLDNK